MDFLFTLMHVDDKKNPFQTMLTAVREHIFLNMPAPFWPRGSTHYFPVLHELYWVHTLLIFFFSVGKSHYV